MAEAPVKVTIKSGKAYDDHWVSFEGTSAKEIREHIIDYFELSDVHDLTAHEVTVKAEEILQGSRNVARDLGGSITKSEKSKPAKKAEPEAAPEGPTVYDKIEAAEDRSRMDEIWAEHRREFKDADLKAAWIKKAKALKEAAA